METTALPVLVDVADPSVARHVEGILGWQPISRGPGLVAPGLALVDRAVAVPDGVPVILLVTDTVSPVVAAHAARGADAVVAWPAQAQGLADVAADVLRRRAAGPAAPVVPTLGVGSASGGVGATTVALAIAGLAAWDLGLDCLAIVRGWVPCPTAPDVTQADLAATSLWASAATVAGLGRLRVLRLVDLPAQPVSIGPDPGGAGGSAWPARVVVEVAASVADILVARPDAAGMAALASTAAGTIVVVGDGPASDRAVRAAAHGRRVVRLPADPRVGHATWVNRVPAGLPGSFLAALRSALG